MDGSDNTGRIGRSVRDAGDYAGLYADRLRLSLIGNLSVFFNALFGVSLLMILLGIAAVFFAVALTWGVGLLIGSMLLAVVLMGCLFLLLALLVYLLRRRLILDRMVRTFAGMVHDVLQKDSDDD